MNGGKHFRSIAYKHMSMHDWLLDYHKKAPEGILDKEEQFQRPPDIYALGFEELVDLNANNIISTRYGCLSLSCNHGGLLCFQEVRDHRS